MAKDEINENQEEAFDLLVEMGGEERWVKARDVAHWNTMRALARRRVIQIKRFRGDDYAAVAGVLLDSPTPSSTQEKEEENVSE